MPMLLSSRQSPMALVHRSIDDYLSCSPRVAIRLNFAIPVLRRSPRRGEMSWLAATLMQPTNCSLLMCTHHVDIVYLSTK